MNTIANAELKKEYTISKIDTGDKEIMDFLFTLGCYENEKITVISKLAGQFVIVVKDARYSIDDELAECIHVI